MAELVNDTFDRANSADLGSTWDVNSGFGSGAFEILSNEAHITSGSNGNDGVETNNSATMPANQYAEATLGTTSNAGLGAGYGVGCRVNGASTATGYRLIASADGWEIARFVTGTFTSLGAFATTTFAAGDVARLEITTNGANADWVVKKNGSTVTSGTGSDTSPITASGRVAVMYSSTDSTGTGLASFRAGDFNSGSVALSGSAGTIGIGSQGNTHAVAL